MQAKQLLWSVVLAVGVHAMALMFIVWSSLELPRHADVIAQTAAQNSLEVQPMTETDFENRLKKALGDDAIAIVQTDSRLTSKRQPNQDQKVYLSKAQQWAAENTRAAHVGAFWNDPGPGKGKPTLKKLATIMPHERDLEQERALQSRTGIERGPANIPLNLESAQNQEENLGGAQTDDYLPDVAVGAQTLLNTKEYIFYGFFERIRHILNERWHERLRGELGGLHAQGKALSKGDRITQVAVYLNSQGLLQRIELLASSGVHELDQAAVDAFRLAAPFPNPPSGMIEKESVRIRWDFVVSSVGGSGLRLQVKRPGM